MKRAIVPAQLVGHQMVWATIMGARGRVYSRMEAVQGDEDEYESDETES